jgi:hypothetical protein
VSGRSGLRIWGPAALGALVIGGLWAASDRPPRLPADADHGAAQAESTCLSCHGHAARKPRPADHPPRDDCFSCHKDPAGVLHPRKNAPTSIPGGWADDPRRR